MKMFEIELKAVVRDMLSTEENIARFAHFLGRVDKQDCYYTVPSTESPSGLREFRIRIEGKNNIVTFKENSKVRGIEMNRECEFTVSSAENFDHFANFVGATAHFRKHKQGKVFSFKKEEGSRSEREIKLELFTIEHLGNFLEIETIVSEDASAERIAQAKDDILEALILAGLNATDIEERSYMSMLKALPAELWQPSK